MRVRAQRHADHLDQHFAPQIQGTEFDLTTAPDNFERRIQRGDIPPRIAFRVFVAGRQIDAAPLVEFPQQVAEAASIGNPRQGPGDVNPGAGGIAKQAHGRWKPSG
jgi:hypothetical protein